MGKEKIFEAALFMPYEAVKDGVRLLLLTKPWNKEQQE